MWLVLCEDDDACAQWAHNGLAARGLVPIELLLASALTPSLRWVHRVGPGRADTEIELGGGALIQSGSVRGVFNRLTRIPYWCGQSRIPDEDWAYGRQELAAFFLSWMASFTCPMLNRPSPRGLSGGLRHTLEWSHLASAAGLRVPDCLRTVRAGVVEKGPEACPASASVLVVGDAVMGCPAREWMAPCRNLARLAEVQILGIDLCCDRSDGWTFQAATTHPDLRSFGDVSLIALEKGLRGGGELA